jgi:hypothetical protein
VDAQLKLNEKIHSENVEEQIYGWRGGWNAGTLKATPPGELKND